MRVWDEVIELSADDSRPKLNAPNTEAEEDIFFDYFLEPAFKDDLLDPSKVIQEMMEMPYDKSDAMSQSLLIEKLIHVIVAHLVRAVREERVGNLSQAWTHATDTAYWAGILSATWGEVVHRENPAAMLAKRRHAENYSMIEAALSHWKENINPNVSAQKAANELVRIVPLSHKKLAEIISAEKKKLKK